MTPTKTRTPPYRVVARGVDTLVVNAHGRLAATVVAALDAAQAQALAERAGLHGGKRESLAETPYRICGQPLLCAAHGAGKGQWRWLLRCPAATLEVGGGQLNGICCRVTLSSPFLWRYGPRRAWAYVALLLDTWSAADEEAGAGTTDEAPEVEGMNALAPRSSAVSPDIAQGFYYQVSELHCAPTWRGWASTSCAARTSSTAAR
jgi:hypothetical protein